MSTKPHSGAARDEGSLDQALEQLRTVDVSASTPTAAAVVARSQARARQQRAWRGVGAVAAVAVMAGLVWAALPGSTGPVISTLQQAHQAQQPSDLTSPANPSSPETNAALGTPVPNQSSGTSSPTAVPPSQPGQPSTSGQAPSTPTGGQPANAGPSASQMLNPIPRWTTPVAWPSNAVPVPGGVVVLRDQTSIAMLDAATGTTRWSHPLNLASSIATVGSSVASTQASGAATVVALSAPGGHTLPMQVTGYDAASGDQRWQRQVPAYGDTHALLLTQGEITVVLGGTSLDVFATSSGEPLWSKRTSDLEAVGVTARWGRVAIGQNMVAATLAFGDVKGRVYAWQANSGQQLWLSDFAATSFGGTDALNSIAIGKGSVIVGTRDPAPSTTVPTGNLTWLDGGNGQVTHTAAAGRSHVWEFSVDAASNTVLRNDMGTLSCYDATTGAFVWRRTGVANNTQAAGVGYFQTGTTMRVVDLATNRQVGSLPVKGLQEISLVQAIDDSLVLGSLTQARLYTR